MAVIGFLHYHVYGTFNLVVILIWWFGNFGFNRHTKCTPTLIIVTCIMNISQGIYTLNITLIPKLNVRQFALRSNSPNFLMFTTYCVYDIHLDLKSSLILTMHELNLYIVWIY